MWSRIFIYPSPRERFYGLPVRPLLEIINNFKRYCSMKKIYLLAFVAVMAFSCAKSGNDPDAGKKDCQIVGEWSGVPSDFQIPEGEQLDDCVRVHFNFKADGTFEQIMPAWGEKDLGKYTVSGDLVTFELTSLTWLWDKTADGWHNVYDQYGCFWDPDKYAENRTQYPDPFAKFCEGWPDRAKFSAKYSFDKNGNLLFDTVSGEGAGIGLELVYYKNPGFKPTKPEVTY